MPKKWLPLKEYEDSYLISNYGDVLSIKDQFGKPRRLLRKLTLDKKTGYVRVDLHKKGCKPSIKYIHRLVAETFLAREEGKKYVNHKDSNRANNHVDNLEWCTQSENIQHGYTFGNIKPTRHRLNKSNSKNRFKLIYFEKSRGRWVASVEKVNNPKIKKTKSFSVKKYGELLAELKAAEAVNIFLSFFKDEERKPNKFTSDELNLLKEKELVNV